jgi:hypothetical protein
MAAEANHAGSVSLPRINGRAESATKMTITGTDALRMWVRFRMATESCTERTDDDANNPSR